MRNSKKKFGKIYDKYVEKIYRFVFLKVSSQEIAEDLTSQVFTKGWRKFRKEGADIENVSAYLYQIARTEIANHYRGKPKFKIISTEATPIIDPQSTAEENFGLQSELEILKKSLVQLRDDYQNVLIWKYIDGHSNKEIAEILGKSRGAVRVMLHRALNELRQEMSRGSTSGH